MLFIQSLHVCFYFTFICYSIVYFYLLLASFSALLNYEVGRSLSLQTVAVGGNYKAVEVAVQENYKAVEVVVRGNCKVAEVAVEENCRAVERGSCKAVEEED